MSRFDHAWWSFICLLMMLVGPSYKSMAVIHAAPAPSSSLGSTPCHKGESELPADVLVIEDTTGSNLETPGSALPEDIEGAFAEKRSQRIIERQGELIRGTIGARAAGHIDGFELDASRTNEITLIDPNHPCNHHANSTMTVRPFVTCVISGITLKGSISQSSGAANLSAFQGTDQSAPVEKFATIKVTLTEDRRPNGKAKTLAEVTKNRVTTTFEVRFGPEGDFVVAEGTDALSYAFDEVPFASFARNGFVGVVNPIIAQASETLSTKKLNKKAASSYASANCFIVAGNVPQLSDNEEENIKLPKAP